MREWSLREEILIATHQWPVILAFILVGCTLGIAASYFWQSPYEATSEVFVGLNIANIGKDENIANFTGGLTFNYVDDYKNWQMANLNTVIYSNDIVRITLERLIAEDAYWKQVTRPELSNMLQVYWRNPGRWRMVATHPDPQRAAQASSIWRDVIVESVSESVMHSQDTLNLGNQLESLADIQQSLSNRLVQLQEIRDGLNRWSIEVGQLPADAPLEPLMRWRGFSLASQAAGYDPAWQTALGEYPDADALPAEYLTWLVSAEVTLNELINILENQLQALAVEQEKIATEYERSSRRSRGFAPTLVVERVSGGPTSIAQVRPTAQLGLIGGALGLLAWILFWFGRLAMEAKQQGDRSE
jgi:hypothetical protein